MICGGARPVVVVSRRASSRPHLVAVLRESRKSANIYASLGFIRGIPGRLVGNGKIDGSNIFWDGGRRKSRGTAQPASGETCRLLSSKLFQSSSRNGSLGDVVPWCATTQLAKSMRWTYRGPRTIATDRQAPRVYPRVIPHCSRFDSVLFTPKMFAIASYGNFSRSPIVDWQNCWPLTWKSRAIECAR